MNTTGYNNDDNDLRKVLQEGRTEVPLPPRFQEQVWRRIEGASAPAGISIRVIVAQWIGTMLPRPALAVAYVAILLAFGATAGWSQGRHQNSRVKDDLGQRYVRALDPYQAPRR